MFVCYGEVVHILQGEESRERQKHVRCADRDTTRVKADQVGEACPKSRKSVFDGASVSKGI